MELLRYIVSYRSQNELEPIEFLPATVENYVCGLPENKGCCERYTLKRGLLQYLKGGLAVIKQLYTGEPVQEEEANRRGAICITCVNNVFPPNKGEFMGWSDNIAMKTIGKGKHSAHHQQLGNCQVCTCLLKAKVWYQPPFKLKAKEAVQMRKDKPECWQLPENECNRIDTQHK